MIVSGGELDYPKERFFIPRADHRKEPLKLMDMELWYTEKQTPHFGITAKISRTLHHEQTPFQRMDVIETEQFGRMLVLDGMVMTTDRDEFVYHEMLTHVGMNTHQSPKRVLVVGGGWRGHPGGVETSLCGKSGPVRDRRPGDRGFQGILSGDCRCFGGFPGGDSGGRRDQAYRSPSGGI